MKDFLLEFAAPFKSMNLVINVCIVVCAALGFIYSMDKRIDLLKQEMTLFKQDVQQNIFSLKEQMTRIEGKISRTEIFTLRNKHENRPNGNVQTYTDPGAHYG